MKFRFSIPFRLLLAVGLVSAFAACDEKLDSGLACPALCPHQQADLQSTTLFPVVVDSSIPGYPSLGAEVLYYVTDLGDTLETAAIVRFDSLPTYFRRSQEAEDSLIYAVDSASIKFFIVLGDTIGPATTIEIYDVDLGGADDTDPLAVRGAFTPDRLIGTRTVPADSMRDTVVVPISNAVLLQKILAEQDSLIGGRLRIGIKVSTAGGGATTFRMLSAENPGAGTVLRFRPHSDPAIPLITDVPPRSTTPDNIFLKQLMRDYFVVLQGPPEPPADVLRVGGLPGRRVYLRFDLPASLIDSSNVVRATLVLTQRPNRGAPLAGDSVFVRELRVVAGPDITDIARALTFTQRFRSADSVYTTPADTGVREFELIDLVRAWRGTDPLKTPRAIALEVIGEGEHPSLVDFFSNEAAASLRPHIRFTFLPAPAGGLP